MLIKDSKKIHQIQTEFNAKFPYLKIEFYRSAHHKGEGNPNRDLLDKGLSIAEVRSSHTSGELSINGHLKAGTLEQNFKEIFGLNVQVFRKSGDLWLQTTQTDHWTLTMQNNYAQEGIKSDFQES